MFAATTLSLVVVITGIGVDAGKLSHSTAAGMFTVLLFPMLALRALTRETTSAGAAGVGSALARPKRQRSAASRVAFRVAVQKIARRRSRSGLFTVDSWTLGRGLDAPSGVGCEPVSSQGARR